MPQILPKSIQKTKQNNCNRMRQELLQNIPKIVTTTQNNQLTKTIQ